MSLNTTSAPPPSACLIAAGALGIAQIGAQEAGAGERRGLGEIDAEHAAARADARDRDLGPAAGAQPRSTTRRPGRSRWKRSSSSISLKAARDR